MQDIPFELSPLRKVPKKVVRHKILVMIADSLGIPADVQGEGYKLHKAFIDVGPERLKSAISVVQPYYELFFSDGLSSLKLCRWADSDGKTHKGCYIESEESKIRVFEKMRTRINEGCSMKSLETELVFMIKAEGKHFEKEKVSRSFVSRLVAEFKAWNQEEAQFLENDNQRSIQLLVSMPESMDAIGRLYQELH